MKWGFGWEMGPFEAWDALGVEKAISKMESEGKTVPAWVKEMVEKGFTSFYKEEDGRLSYYHNGEYVAAEENPKAINLKHLKKQKGVIKKNGGAS